MNIQQFNYVLAVAEHKHFELAADKCFITQSTLSTMISKFEDEIGIKIFDRKKKPVSITDEGALLIEQLKIIRNEINKLDELVKEIKGEVKGELSISVIPTIAPFLLPLFLQEFASRFIDLQIRVREQTTPEIIRQLKSREIDMGIVSLPLNDKDLIEITLYDEPFVYYDASSCNRTPVNMDDIDVSKLFLLEEGHCLRTQVIKLCEVQKRRDQNSFNFEYKAGSIDSLLRFVKVNQAATLIPFLATVNMSSDEIQHVRPFVNPTPLRSVGIVVHRHFVKRNIQELLEKSITSKVKKLMPSTISNGKVLMPT